MIVPALHPSRVLMVGSLAKCEWVRENIKKKILFYLLTRRGRFVRDETNT